MIAIGIINLLLAFKAIERNYFVAVTIGLSFWMMCAVIAYNIYTIIQKEEPGKVHNTIRLFFILNIFISTSRSMNNLYIAFGHLSANKEAVMENEQFKQLVLKPTKLNSNSSRLKISSAHLN